MKAKANYGWLNGIAKHQQGVEVSVQGDNYDVSYPRPFEDFTILRGGHPNLAYMRATHALGAQVFRGISWKALVKQ